MSSGGGWRGDATPLPPEVNPRVVFDRLFGTAGAVQSPADRKSILDFVREDAAALHRELGTPDRRKMDEYLTGVRELEKRIDIASRQTENLPPPGLERPYGIPAGFDEHCDLMFDLMTIALQTDSTRILTMMIAREGSNLTYRQAGVPEAHHQLSHHQKDAEKVEKLTKINGYHARKLALLASKWSQIRDGEGTLLDHTTLVYGSGISDGNQHLHHDLPVLLLGGKGSKLRLGRHVRYEKETPVTNLWLSLLDRMGVQPERLGDSTGQLAHLTDL